MQTIITYEDGMASFGSVRLRAFQVGTALQKYIPIEVLPISACTSRKNALIIVVKPRQYGILRKLFGHGNRIIVDLLDTVHYLSQPATLKQKITRTSVAGILKQVDAAIFCSHKTKKTYSHFFKHPELCHTIYHHWDSRFNRSKKPALDSLRLGYFGLPRKAHLADRLPQIDFHDVRSFERMDSDVFNDYSAHYIVKPDEVHYEFEPLTKIATAAFAQSPVIARRGHEEELLGEDYPYYIDGMYESNIVAVIEKMSQTYQDSIWQDALSRMELIYHETSLPQLVQQYLKLIKQFNG